MVARNYPGATAVLVQTNADRLSRRLSGLSGSWWKPSRWRSRKLVCLPEQSLSPVGMLWANLMLHTSADPQALLKRWSELVLPGGFLMLSCLGPDTLREWRDVCTELGWPPPAHAFTDMHDWGDMLLQAGFAEPVMDMERFTLTFDSPERLLQELRGLGRNLHIARFSALRGKHWHAELKEHLVKRLRDPQSGRLTFTVEVTYGHAFKSAANQPRTPSDDAFSLTLEAVRAKLPRHSKGLRGG